MFRIHSTTPTAAATFFLFKYREHPRRWRRQGLWKTHFVNTTMVGDDYTVAPKTILVAVVATWATRPLRWIADKRWYDVIHHTSGPFQEEAQALHLWKDVISSQVSNLPGYNRTEFRQRFIFNVCVCVCVCMYDACASGNTCHERGKILSNTLMCQFYGAFYNVNKYTKTVFFLHLHI